MSCKRKPIAGRETAFRGAPDGKLLYRTGFAAITAFRLVDITGFRQVRIPLSVIVIRHAVPDRPDIPEENVTARRNAVRAKAGVRAVVIYEPGPHLAVRTERPFAGRLERRESPILSAVAEELRIESGGNRIP